MATNCGFWDVGSFIENAKEAMAKAGKDENGIDYGGYELANGVCSFNNKSDNCISGYSGCVFYNKYQICSGCYSSCNKDYDNRLAAWKDANCKEGHNGYCYMHDDAELAQGSLLKNVDEATTRRARGEGYSKAAANMIGGGAAQDATAQNFNGLAMQQNQAGNTTQADWLSKQGYLDALDQEIKNKKASQGLQTAGAFFNF